VILWWRRGIRRPVPVLTRITIATAATPPAALAAGLAFRRSLIRRTWGRSRHRWPRDLRPVAHAFGIASL